MSSSGRAGLRQYDALGSTFAVRCAHPISDSGIARVFGSFSRSPFESAPRWTYTIDADANGDHVVMRDGSPLARARSWATVMGALLADLNQRLIDSFPGFAVHAGVVASGRAVFAFPGESGAGKSTLTAACLHAGFAYVSDEALCIDPVGHGVVPYPKPIALTREGWARAGAALDTITDIDNGCGDEKLLLSAAQLDAPIARPPLQLTDVFALTRGVGPPHIIPLPRSDALATLIRMSFNHYKAPDQAFAVASELAAAVRMWRLEYSDPRAAAELVRVELASTT